MSGEVLRRAARELRLDSEMFDNRDADFCRAVADWMDFVAAGREAIDGLAKVAALFPKNGTASHPPAEPKPPSQLFRDTETNALAVARAYLGESS